MSGGSLRHVQLKLQTAFSLACSHRFHHRQNRSDNGGTRFGGYFAFEKADESESPGRKKTLHLLERGAPC